MRHWVGFLAVVSWPARRWAARRAARTARLAVEVAAQLDGYVPPVSSLPAGRTFGAGFDPVHDGTSQSG